MARHIFTGLLLLALGCGGAGPVDCADSTIESSCGTISSGACRDAHGNTCIICSGAHVSEGCVYDPNAPLDGGTAICVSDCAKCGAGCVAM
jgi:hypothetical protein